MFHIYILSMIKWAPCCDMCVYVCKILYISVPVYCTSVNKQEVTCFCINYITYSSCILCANQLGNRHFRNTSIKGNTVETWFRMYLGEQAFYTLNQEKSKMGLCENQTEYYCCRGKNIASPPNLNEIMFLFNPSYIYRYLFIL